MGGSSSSPATQTCTSPGFPCPAALGTPAVTVTSAPSPQLGHTCPPPQDSACRIFPQKRPTPGSVWCLCPSSLISLPPLPRRWGIQLCTALQDRNQAPTPGTGALWSNATRRMVGRSWCAPSQAAGTTAGKQQLFLLAREGSRLQPAAACSGGRQDTLLTQGYGQTPASSHSQPTGTRPLCEKRAQLPVPAGSGSAATGKAEPQRDGAAERGRSRARGQPQT